MTSTRALSYDGGVVRRVMPHAYPFTLLDTVQRYEPERRLLIGSKQVSQNEPFLQGHFPGYPILPGVIIIEALSQAAGVLMHLDIALRAGRVADLLTPQPGTSPLFLAESRIKHMAGVYPGDTMSLEAEVTHCRGPLYVFRVCASVDSKDVSKGQLTISSTIEGTL